MIDIPPGRMPPPSPRPAPSPAMNEELTPWFQADQKPARRGVYQTQFTSARGIVRLGFSYWNGRRWGAQMSELNFVLEYLPDDALAIQDKQWRGRTKP